MERLPGIQIARAIAALSIAYYHSWTALVRLPQDYVFPLPLLAEHGWLAVDLFFGISGYVICLVVSKPTFSVWDFLKNRAFRIYPLWIFTSAIFAITALSWRAAQPSETIGYFFYSLTLLPTKDYPFYDLGWTLQHEVAFYLLAAIIAPIGRLPGIICALVGTTIAYHTLDLPWYLHKLLQFHAEFLAGVLAFVVAPRIGKGAAMVSLVLGMALMIPFAQASHDYVAIPLFFAVIGFAQLEYGARFAWIGDASYSIYLIHPLVFRFTSAATSLVLLPTWSAELLRFSCLALVILLAHASWRLFERPMIGMGRSLGRFTPSTSSSS